MPPDLIVRSFSYSALGSNAGFAGSFSDAFKRAASCLSLSSARPGSMSGRFGCILGARGGERLGERERVRPRGGERRRGGGDSCDDGVRFLFVVEGGGETISSSFSSFCGGGDGSLTAEWTTTCGPSSILSDMLSSGLENLSGMEEYGWKF